MDTPRSGGAAETLAKGGWRACRASTPLDPFVDTPVRGARLRASTDFVNILLWINGTGPLIPLSQLLSHSFGFSFFACWDIASFP
ncbi:hypothetical protein ANT_28380 [Anaerolinea thermophila UNI-1]|uniref:Uncharacterized protein n=1 Tax=Anaerolinea thermophila (strain DSM 14523 / JCM 11388 / NBRC 100420 / UNI-1) TaxID=926569 RepID=E8N1C1_ANATU|nr:hypothetical protein ANT_28380 [Anaerolinea thermophila UNI-1]